MTPEQNKRVLDLMALARIEMQLPMLRVLADVISMDPDFMLCERLLRECVSTITESLQSIGSRDGR